jgi:ring-1,2-phenylacetyl-CoA epoxidase subunit PaaE
MFNSILEFIQKTLVGYPATFASSIAVVTVVYIILWVIVEKFRPSNKIQLNKRAGSAQIKNEIINTALVIFTTSFFTSLILLLKDAGLTKLYLDTGRYGILYEILAGFIVLFVNDTWFYWVHRTLHRPSLYKYIHAEHHKSLDTTPFTTYSFHVIEGVLNTLIIFVVLTVMPVSLGVLAVVQLFGLFNNIKSHSGYEFYPRFFASVFPFNTLVTSTHHNLHHSEYNGNYGLMFRFWDLVQGTEIKETQNIFKAVHDRDNKTTKIIDNTKYQTLTISKIEKETKDTVSIYFEPHNPDFYNYKAGQYLNLKVKLGGKVLDRCFSISSSPLDKFLRITVKLNGEVSHYFHDQARVGDKIQSLLPVGDFTIAPDLNQSNAYAMIAGGSGITPLYSMIRTLLVSEPKSKITLFYSNRTTESTIFFSELEKLQSQYKGVLTVQHFSNGVRLASNAIKQYSTANPQANYYICGPTSLKDAAKTYLAESKVNPDNIHTEEFVDGYVPWFGLIK